jgi:hypothetical protein
VSGQNVAFVAAATLITGWTLGLARWLAELGALAAIGGSVLAVGPQTSVVRAGIDGALALLARNPFSALGGRTTLYPFFYPPERI